MKAESRYPASIDAIDASWLGSCIARHAPGTAILALERGTVVRGTANKVEYRIEWDEAGLALGLPPSLWLKCGLDVPMVEQAAHSVIEASFFRDLAPAMHVDLPKPYGTAIAPDGSSGIVIYEDLNLRPVQFGNQDMIVTPDRMEAILDMLASMHAAYWHARPSGMENWLVPGGIIHATDVADQFLGFWDYAAARPRFAHVPEALRARDLVGAAMRKLVKDNAAAAMCVVHGDPHIGNQFYNVDGRPGLLDWATVMLGHWAWDVSYAIISSQTVEQRRACERHQLAYYLGRLASRGVVLPSFESAWRDYARNAAWIFGFALCPAEMQPEEMCIRNAERAAAAMIDLHTVELLLA